MALISLQNISYGIAGRTLLDQVGFQIEPGEKIGLLGRNGAGKSTLLKIINREIPPDSGEIVYRQGVETARLIQEVPPGKPGSCLDIVLEGLGSIGEILRQYHGMLHAMAEDGKPVNHAAFDTLQHEIDTRDGWTVQTRAEAILTRVGVAPDTGFDTLSGGMKRRVFLARALVGEPAVLMLDEPTNHLDIHAIRWMETFLKNYPGALIFVTHDRAFLQNISTRIVEIDRGRLLSWQCGYETFLKRRAEAWNAEDKANSSFDRKLEQEEAWLRQGVKARRLRNQGRLRKLKALRAERRARVERQGTVKMDITGAGRSGHLVSVAEDVCFGYGDNRIIESFTFNLVRGDRLGLVGPNGSGKTTLIRLLLGELTPDSGSVRLGTRLQVAYFDQLRETLDGSKTVLENLGVGSMTFEINGVTKNAMGYLKNFLFEPAQILNTTDALSGGEKNRLLLARLFTRPSNVLVLDEPTNDLDIETLELLEELLADYAGTVIIVSHDRAFINNLTTSTLVLEGDGSVREYPDGYTTWLTRWDERQQEAARIRAEKTAARTAAKPRPHKSKLTYKEKEQLKDLPLKIEQLEKEQAVLQQAISDPGFYQRPPGETRQVIERNEAIDRELEDAFAAWERLDAKA